TRRRESNARMLPERQRAWPDDATGARTSVGRFLPRRLLARPSIRLRASDAPVVSSDLQRDAQIGLIAHRRRDRFTELPTLHLGEHGANRAREPLEVVAAFEHRYDSVVGNLPGGSQEHPREHGEPVLSHLHAGEWIAAMRVEAGRDEDELGSELPCDRLDDVEKRLHVLRVSVTRGERQIQGEALAFSRADLAGGAGAWVEGVLVRRNEQNARIAIE